MADQRQGPAGTEGGVLELVEVGVGVDLGTDAMETPEDLVVFAPAPYESAPVR